jgi:UDP:flavonoid glycosyltransferase YjiC (YdhE family)
VAIRLGQTFDPQQLVRQYESDPSVAASVSDRCRAAVGLLLERHGIPDASPFSAFTDPGGDLNLYSEPPEFVSTRPGEPPDTVEYFGSLWPASHTRPAATPSPFGPDTGDRRRIYISFGTAIWVKCATEATAALEVLADAIAEIPSVAALISLGGRDDSGAAVRLARPNVRVETYVDQIRVLQEAAVYVTHHGLNSTHEAIYYGVPMISYPFLWDQPGIAARCQELGIATPLVSRLQGPVTSMDVHAALDRILSGGEPLRRRLATARQWELDVIARRPAVIRRITALIA